MTGKSDVLHLAIWVVALSQLEAVDDGCAIDRYFTKNTDFSTTTTTTEKPIEFPSDKTTIGRNCCLDITEEHGFCRPIQDCRHVLAKMRRIRPTTCSWEENVHVVCCPSSTWKPKHHNNHGFHHHHYRGNFRPHGRLQAGEENYLNQSLVFAAVGGEPVGNYNTTPWMGAILKKGPEEPRERLICGGALITYTFILTAAHCFNADKSPSSTMEVAIGSSNISSTFMTIYHISQVIKHPNYRPPSLYNDIALVKLDTRVSALGVSPICIPLKPLGNRRKNFDKSESAFVAGWGKTAFAGSTSEMLQEVGLPIVSNDHCGEVYSRLLGFRKSYPSGTTSTILCAGHRDEKKDACSGDSGGPLYVRENNNTDITGELPFLIGIVSSGFRCAVPGVPGIYTRVSSYVYWIKQHVN